MNAVIREAGERQAAAASAARELEASQRAQREADMASAERWTDLLHDALKTLSALLVDSDATPEAMYARKPTSPGDAPTELFFVPAASPFFRWYQRKQPGWYLLSSSRWDQALRLFGEGDLRVAILANGDLSRFMPLDTDPARERLAAAIVDCAARHELVWPADGADLTELLPDTPQPRPT